MQTQILISKNKIKLYPARIMNIIVVVSCCCLIYVRVYLTGMWVLNV